MESEGKIKVSKGLDIYIQREGGGGGGDLIRECLRFEEKKEMGQKAAWRKVAAS